VDYPDTQLYGFNHLSQHGIQAEYKDSNDIPLGRFLGFNIRHILMFFHTRRYDVVFGSSLLNTVILKKIFRTKTKFALLNISLNRLLRSNEGTFKIKFIKWLLKEIDGVVCLSRHQKEFLERMSVINPSKINFVPLGVDEKFYSPVYENRSETILSVGRDNGRDYKTIFKVARILKDTKFEIICSRRNIDGLGDIPENVTIKYDISKLDLKERYQKTKLLLLITHDDNHRDGADCSGQTVLLDAMASGLPVIASRKKCIEDYANDGKEIFLVDFYDKDDIFEKMLMLRDKNVRVNLAKSARRKVEKELSTSTMASKLSDVFKSII